MVQYQMNYLFRHFCLMSLVYIAGCIQQSLSLNLFPLVYDREIKDLKYFQKLLSGFYNLNVLCFVSFVNHTLTRHCKNHSLVLKVPKCKFSKSSFSSTELFLSGIVLLASPGDFSNRKYLDLVTFIFYVNMTCSWSL